MSVYEDLQAAAQEVGASAQAARQRVIDEIARITGEAQTQIAEAKAALQAEIDKGAANATALEGVVGQLTDADATIDSIANVGEEPPPAEPPADTP